jgi:voltage-gated sodium channel
LTLFQVLTLEGWVEIQGEVLEAQPWAWVYFSSFVFVAVFVVVNLFIAVVINNLESVKHEQQVDADRASSHHAVLEAIETVRLRLSELEDRLRAIAPQPGGVGAPAPPREFHDDAGKR